MAKSNYEITRDTVNRLVTPEVLIESAPDVKDQSPEGRGRYLSFLAGRAAAEFLTNPAGAVEPAAAVELGDLSIDQMAHQLGSTRWPAAPLFLDFSEFPERELRGVSSGTHLELGLQGALFVQQRQDHPELRVITCGGPTQPRAQWKAFRHAPAGMVVFGRGLHHRYGVGDDEIYVDLEARKVHSFFEGDPEDPLSVWFRIVMELTQAAVESFAALA